MSYRSAKLVAALRDNVAQLSEAKARVIAERATSASKDQFVASACSHLFNINECNIEI